MVEFFRQRSSVVLLVSLFVLALLHGLIAEHGAE
jgi:hypothetical protein